MSEFGDSVCTEFCAELCVVCRITKIGQKCKILPILFCSVALNSALMAATASAKHFVVKIILHLAVLCFNAVVTGVSVSNCNKFLSCTCSVILVVSWHQKRQRFIELATYRKQNQKVKKKT